YLLHAIDPKTPLETSVRALARLRDDGIVTQIGLSNVTPTQLDAALAIAPIDAVEVELNPWKLDALRGGLLARCTERGIRVLAHRPLGGPNGVKRALRDKLLKQIAARHTVHVSAREQVDGTAYERAKEQVADIAHVSASDVAHVAPTEVVLAWLRSLSPMITVLPGATRVETVASAIRGQRLELDDEARSALAAHLVEVVGASAGTARGGASRRRSSSQPSSSSSGASDGSSATGSGSTGSSSTRGSAATGWSGGSSASATTGSSGSSSASASTTGWSEGSSASTATTVWSESPSASAATRDLSESSSASASTTGWSESSAASGSAATGLSASASATASSEGSSGSRLAATGSSASGSAATGLSRSVSPSTSATASSEGSSRTGLAATWSAGSLSAAVDAPASDREIVLIVGMPGAGKSTIAAEYVGRGYRRLNRDDRGGSLIALARALDDELAAGAGSFVIDNTYPTRASRAPILEVARRHGVPVRCVVLATPIEQAQAFAAQRALERHGAFDAPGLKGEIRPNTQFRYRRDFEPPATDEGYTSIEEVVPVRRTTGTRRALIVELDGVVWLGRPTRPEKIELRPGVLEGLQPWFAQAARSADATPTMVRAAVGRDAAVLGERDAVPIAGRAMAAMIAGRDAIATEADTSIDAAIRASFATGDTGPMAGREIGTIADRDAVASAGRDAAPSAGSDPATQPGDAPLVVATVWRPGVTAEQIAALAARMRELLGHPIAIRHCPHPAGPPVCWCRKPMPGLALALARDHDLDLSRSIHVGRGPADRGFAARAGMQYATINAERAWPRP
ncbi:MAG TPA: aldo/keto reductase, partial [Polyangiaceae bacterium]|nr:aldo/keto reductase [Polyangiaceae bacterium]